jgi:DNA repair protein RadD
MSTFKFNYRAGQEEAVDAIFADMASKNPSKGVIVIPTGGGKSFVIAGVTHRYKDGPTIVLQPSKELLEQNFGKYEMTGCVASIYSASFGKKDLGHVTFGTLGSIISAMSEIKNHKNLLVLCDEAHYKYPPEKGSQFRQFIDTVKPKYLYGLTATPLRMHNSMNGSSLKMITRTKPGVFNKILYVQQISEIISLGYWSPSKDERWVYDDSLLKLNSTGSDYDESSIKRANEANSVNRNIALKILELLKEGKRKSILVFVDSVESAEIFSTYFKKHTTADFIHGGTSTKERKRIIDEFKSLKTRVLFNYGVLSTGFDHPQLDAILMGRPTNSLMLFYQIYGRGVRIFEGKEDFLFVDCCDNFGKLCHPRELSFEDHPIVGWAAFAGEKLVTGAPLLGATITRSDLLVNQSETLKGLDSEVMPFGKYKGRKIMDMCKYDVGYAEYMANTLDTSQYGPRLKNLIIESIKQTAINNLVS